MEIAWVSVGKDLVRWKNDSPLTFNWIAVPSRYPPNAELGIWVGTQVSECCLCLSLSFAFRCLTHVSDSVRNIVFTLKRASPDKESLVRPA